MRITNRVDLPIPAQAEGDTRLQSDPRGAPGHVVAAGDGQCDCWSNIRQALQDLAPRLTSRRYPFPFPPPPPPSTAGVAGAPPTDDQAERRLMDLLLDTSDWPDATIDLPPLTTLATIIKTPGVDLYANDLTRFATPPPGPGSDPACAFLSDAAIDFAIFSLAAEQQLTQPKGLYVLSPTAVALPTNTFKLLRDGRTDISTVTGRIGRQIINLGSTTHLLIPANFSNEHWSLYVVNLTERTIHNVDSAQRHFTTERNKCTELVRQLASEVNKLTGIPQGPWMCTIAETLQQANGYDCAIHVIVNCIVVTSACRVPVSTVHIQRARRWLLWEMLNHLPPHATNTSQLTNAPTPSPTLTNQAHPTTHSPANHTTSSHNSQPNAKLNPLAPPFLPSSLYIPLPTLPPPSVAPLPTLPSLPLATRPRLPPPALPQANPSPLPPTPPPPPPSPPQLPANPPNLPPSAHPSATPIISLNVGPTGIRESFTSLLPLFEANPGVVMLQDVKLTARSAVSFQSWVHKTLPEYALFLKTTLGAKAIIQTATLVHHGLAARATQLPIQAPTAAPTVVPIRELASRVQFIRTLDVHSEVTILWVNMYQYQAHEHERQQALLDLTGSMLQFWTPKVHHVIWGGDFNASLCARNGYTMGLPGHPTPPEQADKRLAAWLHAHNHVQLKCNPPAEPTWLSNDGSRAAVLDFFLCRGLDPMLCTGEDSPDIRHDHRLIRGYLPEAVISPLPPKWDLIRPKRLRMTEWKLKREEWAATTTQSIQSLPPDQDPLNTLRRVEAVALDVAGTVLGMSGGKRNTLIPFHSDKFRKLTAILRIVKSARKDIARRCTATVSEAPSKSMRAAWDRDILPEAKVPWASLAILPYPTAQLAWAKEWLSVLSDRTAATSQQLRDLRHQEITESAKQSRLAAIARMARPGAREVRRLLSSKTPSLSSPYVATSYPDTVRVLDQHDSQLLRCTLSAALLGSACTIAVEGPDGEEGTTHTVKVSCIPPSRLHAVLTLCSPERLLLESSKTQHVHGASDKLTAWESHLAREADATRTRCGACGALAPLPIPDNLEVRGIKHWCPSCCAFCRPNVDTNEYTAFPFDTARTPRVPADAPETLRGQISREDLLYKISQLSRGKAPGADGFVYEFLKDGPPPLQEAVLAAVNHLLTKRDSVPEDWKGGIIRLLFKKGCPMECRNFRPVVLLKCVYKVYTSIITDRLYRLSEKYHLLHPSQEGFRQSHSCGRQAQSLLWAYQQAKEQRETLVVAFLDFANAFNSVDHCALWEYLRIIGVPDVDMIQGIYADSRYQAQTAFGMTAEIFLTRGTKQGDGLSPLLFSLVFNALLLALEASGAGHQTATGLKTPARAFADDVTLATTSVEDMSTLLTIVDQFCNWSGMRLNVPKSEITAYNFRSKLEPDTSEIRVGGQALQRLAPTDPFRYLGFRFSLKGDFNAEAAHIMEGVTELMTVVHKHHYTTEQMTAVMSSITESRFRFSAALVPWTNAQMTELYRRWTMVHKLAFRLQKGLAGALFNLPSSAAGSPLPHPRVALLQALTQHVEQLVLWDDDIRAQARWQYQRLCTRYGCHSEDELRLALSQSQETLACPIFRLMQLSHEMGLETVLPGALTQGAHDATGLSWFELKTRVRHQVDSLKDNGKDTAELESGLAVWDQTVAKLAVNGYSSPARMSLKLVQGEAGLVTRWAVPPIASSCSSFRKLLNSQGRPQAFEGLSCHWSLEAPRASAAPGLGAIIDELAGAIRDSEPAAAGRALMLARVAGDHPKLVQLGEAAASALVTNTAFIGLLYEARKCDSSDLPAPKPPAAMSVMTRDAVRAVALTPVPLRATVAQALAQLRANTPMRPEIDLQIDWGQWRITLTGDEWSASLEEHGILGHGSTTAVENDEAENEDGSAGQGRARGSEEVAQGRREGAGASVRRMETEAVQDAMIFQWHDLLEEPRVTNDVLHALLIRLVTSLERTRQPGPLSRPPESAEHGSRVGGDDRAGGIRSSVPPPRAPPAALQEEDVPLDAALVQCIERDVTESCVTIGQFRLTTKESVTRVDRVSAESSEHWVTAGQARLGFLLAQNADKEATLERAKEWRQRTELDEKGGCCLSAQAWTILQAATEATLLIGAQALTAGSAFSSAWSDTVHREGWSGAQVGALEGDDSGPHAEVPLVTMLGMCAAKQAESMEWLLTQDTCHWFALTRRNTLSSATLAALEASGTPVGVLKKGLPCLQRLGSSTGGGLRTTGSREDWTLWAGNATPDCTLERTASTLRDRREVWSSVRPPAPDSLTWREHRHGPGAPYYDRPGAVLATDGSVLADGRMGTAAVSKDGRIEKHAVDGLPSSLRAELHGLLLAVKITPLSTPLTILTDSLCAIQNLESLRRSDFRHNLMRHAHRVLIREVVVGLRARTASTLIVKVLAHCGEPLNEAADAAANTAVSEEPLPAVYDPLVVYFKYTGLGPRVWGAGVKRHVLKTATEQWQKKLLRDKIKIPVEGAPAESKLNVTESWLLRPGQGREILGSELAALPNGAKKRKVLQALGGCYPTQTKLRLWKLSNTSECSLCHGGDETLAHLQCWCPKLSDARIKAHHHVWRSTWAAITDRDLPDWSYVMEMTAERLAELRAPTKHAAAQSEWLSKLSTLTDGDTALEEEEEEGACHALGQLVRDLRAAGEQTKEQRYQLIESSAATRSHEMAGILLVADASDSLDHVLRQIWQERSVLMGGAGIARKRPDGFAVNWARRTFYILEYTRCYDSSVDALERADSFKTERYEPLLRALSQRLGRAWSGRTLTFSTGVKGSIDPTKWDVNLKLLGLNETQRASATRRAVGSTLEAMEILFAARGAARASQA